MPINDPRFARHMPLFGSEGQEKIAATSVAVVGVGGIGSHVVQQLALLGVRNYRLIEPQKLDDTNRNRFIGARHDDPVPGTHKLEIAERVIRSVEPSAEIERIVAGLVSAEAFGAVRASDVVFGCVDKDGPRLILSELCAAYDRRYIDLATDVIPGDPPEFGGRVCIRWDGSGCLDCFDELDREEARTQIAGPTEREQWRRIYGIDEDVLHAGGPSVVSVNGVTASLGVTEFMAGITGLRRPHGVLRYRGWSGKVFVANEPQQACYYCTVVRGTTDAADVERYIRDGVGAFL